MKVRTTQKAVKQNFDKVVCVGYCNLQHLLHYESPYFYTARVEGWAADVYNLGGGVAIVTGYAPFGNIKPSYAICDEYDRKAKAVLHDDFLSYEEREKQIEDLLKEFVEKAVN